MLKVGLLCGVIAAMSATGVSSVLPKNVESKSCDSRFIVELEEDIDSLTSEEVNAKQNEIFKKIKGSVNGNAKLSGRYSVLTNSIVVSANKEDIEAISSLSGVKTVVESRQHMVTKSAGSDGFTLKVSRASGAPDINENASAVTMNKKDGTNEGEGTLIAILDNEFYLRGKTSSDPSTPYSHEVFTKLDSSVKTKIKPEDIAKLTKSTHARVDSAHALQGYEGSLYFNNKVPFYYDYAGDSENGSSHGVPTDPKTGAILGDYNVESTIGLHGSHVASIAAANAPTYKGIAPKAQLACMKVFSDVRQTPAGEAANPGNYSTFTEEGFLYALEDAMSIGADAINVSIGSDLDDFDMSTVTMKALEKLTDGGVLSAISAGNGGKQSYAFAGGYGNWTRDMVETGILGSYANNVKTMSVAAGQPNSIYYENAFKMGDDIVAFEDQIVNIEGQPKDYNTERRIRDLYSPDGKFDWVYVPGFGSVSDYNGIDVDGKIAIVNRGSIDFSTKYLNAKANNAKALVIINNDPTAMDFNFRCSFGDEKNITIPVALVLFKDKPLFQTQGSGSFTLISKQLSENKAGNTMSDFSSEGARFDLDLKPEITAPGTSIKGAVWPQNKEEKETPFAAYEYFNGTSMSSPNYAGAMSVLVSEKAKAAISDGRISETEEAELKEFRKTVNMRFMSTATLMKDYLENGEDGKISYTSPRQQGAGMANIDGAYNTEVYLKGSDGDKVLDKSKILLRNNEDIAKGDLKLSFTAVNEGTTSHKYDAKIIVMRPATVNANKIVSKDYNLVGEVGDLNLIPGLNYAVLRSGAYEMETNSGEPKYKDVINVSRDLEYYATVEDANNKTNLQKFTLGYWYYSENNKWEPLPDYLYLSTKDRVIAEITGQEVEALPGETKITINPYSLTQEQKDEIEKLYPYGTYIEGFVVLTAKEENVPNLSIPYLGFYSLSDKDASKSYSDAPVVEPFSFEKDKKTIYPSDLVNDVTKQLLGKDNANFESMWVAGYAKKTSDIDTDSVLINNKNFSQIQGFYNVGTDPTTGANTEHPEADIYVGNSHTSNTMIIQQFVLRSVKDNYFTITNKETGQEVYRSALEDMLFGEDAYKYPLFKSHVSADYLGGGYVACRAYAIVPLYDLATGKAFASGDYEVKFNYQLAATDKWVDKTYTMHIDSDVPVVNSLAEFIDGKTNKVRITFKDTRVAYVTVGSTIYTDVKYDEANSLYYVDVDRSDITRAMADTVETSFSEKRLFISATDYARGTVGALVHFDNEGDYSHFTILQGYGLTVNHDFNIKEDGTIELIVLDEWYNEVPASLVDTGVIAKGSSTVTQKGVSTGLVIGLSCGGGALLLGGAALAVILILKKKKIIGGK